MANSTEFNGTTHANLKMRGNGTTTKNPRASSSAAEKVSKTEKKKVGAGARPAKASRAERVERNFTAAGGAPLETVVYERRSSIITSPDGSIVFKMEGAEVPAGWSQLATDIVISKYFRRAGLHGDKDKGETSVRQVVRRIAHTIRRAADEYKGYFASKADADAFEAELSYLLVNQYGAFNSPVWFNCGLWHAYGIAGSGGNWAWNMDVTRSGQPGQKNGASAKG